MAGLSMGGYGALKLGLRCPDLFAGCAGFSGCLDMEALRATLTQVDSGLLGEAKAIFGEDLVIKPEDNLFYLVEKDCLASKNTAAKGHGHLWNGRFPVCP